MSSDGGPRFLQVEKILDPTIYGDSQALEDLVEF